MNLAQQVEKITHVIRDRVENNLGTDAPEIYEQLSTMATDPNLLLTSGQRGAFNYYSNPRRIWDAETLRTFKKILSDLKKTPVPDLTFGSGAHADSSALSTPLTALEPMVSKVAGGYSWYMVNSSSSPSSPLIIDSTTYNTLKEAQLYADQFLTHLIHHETDQGRENWLQLGVLHWMSQTPPDCSVQILQVQDQPYLMVKEQWSEVKGTAEDYQTARTQAIEHKVRAHVPQVIPFWSARGFMSGGSGDGLGSFYLAFPFKTDLVHVDVEKLKQLLCTK
jgi:hypothetical protein